jgi:excinuclease UvrABC ATPase subunit
MGRCAAEGEEPRRILFSEKFACPVSGFTISEIEPRLFSFNNPSAPVRSVTAWGPSWPSTPT